MLKSHLTKGYFVTESGIWPLTAQKPMLKRQGWWEGKSASFWRLAAGGRADSCLKANSPLTVSGKSFQGDLLGVQAEGGATRRTASSAVRAVLQLVIGGLISIFLVVLSTVSLQFQVLLFFISLSPVLGIVAAWVTAVVG